MDNRWRAKKGENYFYVTPIGTVSSFDEMDFRGDNSLYKAGNYFKTKEEAKNSKFYKAFHPDDKIHLDNYISEFFGYLDIKTSVRFAKISEEYEEVAERYVDGDIEEMFLELLDLIQAAKSYLVFITRKLLKPKKVIELLAKWKEKQENRKVKYQERRKNNDKS